MHQQEFSSIEDFVFNSSFRNWLLDNNSIHKEYWENWIIENPEKVPVLNYAKAIVFALTVNHKQLSEEEIGNEIRAILKKTDSLRAIDKNVNAYSVVRKPVRPIYKKLAIAAAVVISFSVLSITYFGTKRERQSTQADFYELPAESSSSEMEQLNNSDTIQPVTLFDGSNVQLYPKSKLSFSHGSFSKKREVYLTGEAFFNVTKNPSIPFVVYTKNLVTKVLGTRFNVKAYSFENKVSVQVRAGKVSVYRKENFSEKNAVANKLEGVIVIPNQEVIYDMVNNQLRKTIIDEPVVLANNIPDSFVFSATPLKEVFKTLQNIYGITFIYDESVINSCSLSASMGNESFYEKLELICKAINASYESIDGTIFISSQGCN